MRNLSGIWTRNRREELSRARPPAGANGLCRQSWLGALPVRSDPIRQSRSVWVGLRGSFVPRLSGHVAASWNWAAAQADRHLNCDRWTTPPHRGRRDTTSLLSFVRRAPGDLDLKPKILRTIGSPFGARLSPKSSVRSVTCVSGRDPGWLVGAEGFEPPTSCSQSRRATRLRHAPTASLIVGGAPPRGSAS